MVVGGLRRGERHDAEGEVQTARVDDDGGVEPVDGRFVREPGGRQRRDGAAELCVVANGEGEEVGRAALQLVGGVDRVLPGARSLGGIGGSI